jgi:hypothetical protein
VRRVGVFDFGFFAVTAPRLVHAFLCCQPSHDPCARPPLSRQPR